MPNPARLLLKVLDDWTVPQNTAPETVRQVATEQALLGWRLQGRGAALLNDLERALTHLRVSGLDVSGYEYALPRWYQAVFNFTVPFQSTATFARVTVDEQGRAMLQMLALQLDTVGYAAEVAEEQRNTVVSVLKEVLELLRDDTSLPPTEKQYVWGLVVEARDAVEQYDSLGVMTVRSRVQEAAGAVDAVAAEITKTDPKKGGRLFDLAVSVSTAVTTTLATDGAKGLLGLAAAEARRAITGG